MLKHSSEHSVQHCWEFSKCLKLWEVLSLTKCLRTRVDKCREVSQTMMMLWQADSISVITLAHNNNAERRFVSSGVNVLMSNSAYLSVINNALINQESGFMRFISRMVQRTSARRESDLLITSMITDRTGRHEVLSPVNQNHDKIWERN